MNLDKKLEPRWAEPRPLSRRGVAVIILPDVTVKC